MESVKEQQNNMLDQVQSEIKSLKNLLLRKNVGPGNIPPSGSSGLVGSGWKNMNSNMNSPLMSPTSTVINSSGTKDLLGKTEELMNDVQVEVNTKPAIPAWQLEAAKSNLQFPMANPAEE